MAVFSYLARVNSVSADRATAELLADEIYETARYVGPPTWGYDEFTGVRTFTLGNGSRNSFRWTFEPSRVESSGMGEYWQIKVTVDWKEFKDGVEQGRRELTRVRYLYLDDL